MVEACDLQGLVEDRRAMRIKRRIEQRHIGQIGEHRCLIEPVVRHRPSRAHPDILPGFQLVAGKVMLERHRPDLDRPLALPVFANGSGRVGQILVLDLLFAEQFFRRRHVGHLRLMIETRLLDLERARQRENRLAMLNCNDAAGVEARAVADALDLIDDRHRGITGPHEIGMQ